MNSREREELLLGNIDEFLKSQEAVRISKVKIQEQIDKIIGEMRLTREELDIAVHAVELITKVSDDIVKDAYTFLEGSLNSALKEMFKDEGMSLRIHEYNFKNQYPQLELELTTAAGIKRYIKSDEGHGVAQIVSLLSLISLIVLTGARKILVLDEVLYGLSAKNRELIDALLEAFTHIGFQFIINERGFIPKGAVVHEFTTVPVVTNEGLKTKSASVSNCYIEESGVYLGNAEADMDIETPLV